jgi:hypothetical protein
MVFDDESRGSTQPMTNHLNMNSKEPAAAGNLVHVVVRLVDGDRVLAGSSADPAEAHRIAEELLGKFAQPDTASAWPLVDGRYVRPEAVVSIDVVQEEHRRWGGSAERARIMDIPESAA